MFFPETSWKCCNVHCFIFATSFSNFNFHISAALFEGWFFLCRLSSPGYLFWFLMYLPLGPDISQISSLGLGGLTLPVVVTQNVSQ